MAETPAAAGWTIERLAGERDLAGVLEVDEASFTRPWTRAMYTAEFLNRDTSRLYVLRTPEYSVAGYCAAWFICEEVHINNLAVRPQCRRRGYASALLKHVLVEASASGGRRATLEVRRSNESARRLYERFGFRIAGVRRDYYSHPTEDALILWRDDLTLEGR